MTATAIPTRLRLGSVALLLGKFLRVPCRPAAACVWRYRQARRRQPNAFADSSLAADELAAGASLVMGQAAEGTPVVHVRGFPYPLREGSLVELIRPKDQDLFR